MQPLKDLKIMKADYQINLFVTNYILESFYK